MNLRSRLLLIFSILTASTAQAQPEEEPKIESDRKDFTLGTGIVPRGHIQIETGLTTTRRGDEREAMLGETIIRVPISSRAEVRFDLPIYSIQRQTTRQAGLDDGSLEARFQFSKKEKSSTALTLYSTIPSGSKRVAERRYQPGATFAAQRDLSEGTSLIFNLGAQSLTEDKQRFTQLIAAAEVRHSVSKDLDAFSELYVLSRDEKDGPTQKFLAAGAVYFLGKRTALDARFGLGLFNRVGGPSYEYSAGVSHLF